MPKGLRRERHERIAAFVRRYPGLSAESIAKAIALPPVITRTHLAELARAGRTRVYRHREVERHFATPGFNDAECELVSLLRERGPRKIIEAIVQRGMTPQASLGASLGIAPIAYRHYVTRLRTAHLLMTIEDSATSTTLLAAANVVELRTLLRTVDEPAPLSSASGGERDKAARVSPADSAP